jgi:hypothetical protein
MTSCSKRSVPDAGAAPDLQTPSAFDNEPTRERQSGEDHQCPKTLSRFAAQVTLRTMCTTPVSRSTSRAQSHQLAPTPAADSTWHQRSLPFCTMALGVVAVLREHLAQIPPSDPEDLIFDGPGGGVAAKQPPSIIALARTRSRGVLVLPVLPELPPRTRQQIGAQLATVLSSEPADRAPGGGPGRSASVTPALGRPPIDPAQPLNVRPDLNRGPRIGRHTTTGFRGRDLRRPIARHRGGGCRRFTREGSTCLKSGQNRGRAGLTMPAVQAKGRKVRHSRSEDRDSTCRLPTVWDALFGMRSGCTRAG